jgi:uncharacterized protein DUF2802
MITIELNLVSFAGVLGTAFGFGALAAHWRAARQLRSLREDGAALESRAGALRRELDRVAAAGAKARSQAESEAGLQRQAHARTLAQLQRVEAEYAKIADRMNLVEFRGEGRSIDQAIDFARRGAEPDKLTAKFGLGRAEADLVAKLHGRLKSA